MTAPTLGWLSWFPAMALAMASCVACAATPTWADPAKVLRVSMEGEEAGLDPQANNDTYSQTVYSAIFDALFQFEYPDGARIVPGTAIALPEISADGLTWLIRVRPGIHFADDPVFGGKPRELTAQDYVYSWKRTLDPRVRSPFVEILAGRLVGARAAMAKAKASGHFDYDADLEGLRAIDRYTLRLNLTAADYTMIAYLAGPSFGAVAREVVEKYGSGGRVADHPVGTGAFRIKDWRRGQKIVLEANPNYREEYFPEARPGAAAEDRALAAAMSGKRLPQVGRVELSIIEPPQPQLLAFDSGALDYLDLPFELARKVLDADNRLLPGYTAKNVSLQRVIDLYVGFLYFNMEDPVVGGYEPERVALRRAIAMAYDANEEIRIIRNGQGVVATQPVPPSLQGHVAGLDIRAPYDPASARALLDKFNYRDRNGDGYRERPDGTSLTLHVGTTPEDRERDDLLTKSLRAIGIRVEFVNRRWAELNKMASSGQLQTWLLGWFATSADGFWLPLYGPEAGGTNLARFRNAEFDQLYVQSRAMRDDAERTRIYERMSRIVGAWNPWMLRVYAVRSALVYPWIQGYSRNPHFLQAWRFVDVDVARRAKSLAR